PDHPVQTPKSASANPGNSRAKVVVASSAAALVSDRAYRPHTSDTSTAILEKNDSFLTKPGKAGLCADKKVLPPFPELWRHNLALTFSQSTDLSEIEYCFAGVLHAGERSAAGISALPPPP
ncbi:hypothetical protein, partial [Ensifer sp.]|uniref:hypothetical protein n=1 Tax=Ensifer sp. TaxID=1872086 RepID=UPI002E1467D0|nr:hypothetical protein [Ensifer sp.]